MLIHSRSRLPSALWILMAVVLPSVARAAPIETLASDATGVTLKLTVPGYRLAPGDDGRAMLVVPGLYQDAIPGRPRLPEARALLALPPGARASVRVIAEEGMEEQTGVRLAIGDRPVFHPSPSGGPAVPAREPVPAIVDGPWPAAPAELGEPYVLRRQHIVGLSLRPFRYDEATGRLWTRTSLTVRVDFTGAEAALPGRVQPDRHWEPVLKEALLNYDQAQQWRITPRAARRVRPGSRSLFEPELSGAGGGGFDESHPEVRVRIDSTGFYELRYPELAALGYPAGTPVARVSVHRHEFVENVEPPYTTIELPIEVVDRNTNGVFDGTDRILMFVQAWSERARASVPQRLWGDGEVVYATVVDGNGLRMATRPGWRGATGLTPLASYPWTQRWERNFSYFLFPDDTLSDQFHWNEVLTYYERPDTFAFQVNHIDAAQPVTFAATFQGRASAPHLTWARIRSCPTCPFVTVVDSLPWSGKGARTLSRTMTGDAFGEGGGNALQVFGRNGGTPEPHPTQNNSDFVALNYFQATYWRQFRALQNYLSANSADASGEFQIRANGFLSFVNGTDIQAYDVTDSAAPVRLALDPSQLTALPFNEWQVDIQDSTAAGQRRNYVVLTTPKRPPAANFSAVTRRQLTDLTGEVDYLVIAPEAFLPALPPLVALRQSTGLRVAVAPLESVQDEFNGGRKSSHAIKRYVTHALDNWNARFLLLVGDGSEDPQNFMGNSSTDWVPIQKISGPVFISFGYEIVPSDPWYGCIHNRCNVNDAVPDVPELFIGRLPVASLQQAQEVVAKLVTYENFAADQTWRNKLLLCADDEYSGDTFFGGGGSQPAGYCRQGGELVFRFLNDEVASIVADSAGLRRTELDRFYLSTFIGNLATLPPGPGRPDTCRVSREEARTRTHNSVTPLLLSRLSEGRMWWNYQGHANQYVLAHEDLYLNGGGIDDKDALANDNRPFLFSAFSCHANAFANVSDIGSNRGPSLGEDMVNLPVRGAIGSFASSGYEILPSIGADHLNLAWARAMFWTPPHDEFLNDRGARVVLGETIALGLMRSVDPFNFFERGVGLTYHLLGDPGTRLSIGAPQVLVTVNGEDVADDIPVRLRTSGPDVTLEADLVSNTQLTSLSLERTDPSGTVVIPPSEYTVTPSFPDTAATGLGGRRYRITYSTSILPFTHTYVIRTTDRYGVASAFRVRFEFTTVLRSFGNPVRSGDVVPTDPQLSLLVLSPKPIVPADDLTLTLNDDPVTFQAVPAPGDTSGREWVLTWSPTTYAVGSYELELGVSGGTTVSHTFQVQDQVAIRELVAFPNPFDESGTHFSFTLASGATTNLQIRVYTLAGRLVYERVEQGLRAGYHQLPWDGLDAEGAPLANGVYLYRMLASNGDHRAEVQGRLVKLRKPRRVNE
jgi:hypothetical protein